MNKFPDIEMTVKRLLRVVWVLAILTPIVRAQEEEKIQELFHAAIEAMGGETYLQVTDMVSEGQFLTIRGEGAPSIPVKFTDYTKLPDKSRFESGNRKKERDITVFNLGTNEGWILEGQKETREANQEEMRSFKNTVKHSIDMIFRFRYKNPENKLFYLGPGEGKDLTLEMVKLLDPENDEVVIYFDRMSKLPAKIEYWDVNKRGARIRMVDEFSRWHVIQGVNTPLRIDGSVNGRPTSQYFITKITYNNNLEDSFFTKPVPPK